MTMNIKPPYPKRFRVYLAVLFLLLLALLVNVFITAGLTGGRELPEFSQQDWHYFKIFIVTEIAVVVLLLFFAIKAGNIFVPGSKQIQECTEQFRYSGIEPDSHDYVWFDSTGCTRSLINDVDGVFFLTVEKFDWRTRKWYSVDYVTMFCSLDEIKIELFYNYDFRFEENATERS